MVTCVFVHEILGEFDSNYGVHYTMLGVVGLIYNLETNNVQLQIFFDSNDFFPFFQIFFLVFRSIFLLTLSFHVRGCSAVVARSLCM